MKIINKYIIVFSLLFFIGCSDFLEQNPENILTDDEVFSDWNMIQSVLSNFYGRVKWGQRTGNEWQYIYLDEACNSNGGPDYTQNFGDDKWRVYDYDLIRDINQFIEGVRSDAASDLTEEVRNEIEGEARFLRAWTYFNMCRCLGGVPIVGDEVFEYTAGMDVTPLQIARSTEAETYDYVISECTEITALLSTEHTTHSARVNSWTAMALKARAAIYAASIAKYNSLMTSPISTSGGEVGIGTDKADGYYQIALETAKNIIAESGYSLHNSNSDKGINFYEATSIKDNNEEVMWTIDYVYPGSTTQFTTNNIPRSVREDIGGTARTPILNLVEDFEYINDRNGALKTIDSATGEYIFYDNAEDIFKDKDPRLYGTVIYPGSEFRGEEISFQAGRKYKENGVWTEEIGNIGSSDSEGNTITDENGPTTTNEENINKTGFCFRKFLDETTGSGTIGTGSEMWFIQFRYAEIILIAAEAAMELGETGAVDYINQIRERAGIQALSSITLDDIVQERRVEFAFENHRYWDLKRWRIAHKIWNGIDGDPDATHYALFPYVINMPGEEEDGKWVFDKQEAHMSVYPRYFQMKNYYNFFDNGWLSNNPNLVKNPYQ